MSAEQWTTVWTAVLAIGAATFAVLAVVVAIGGLRDVRAMFRRIDAEHSHDADQDRTPAGLR